MLWNKSIPKCHFSAADLESTRYLLNNFPGLRDRYLYKRIVGALPRGSPVSRHFISNSGKPFCSEIDNNFRLYRNCPVDFRPHWILLFILSSFLLWWKDLSSRVKLKKRLFLINYSVVGLYVQSNWGTENLKLTKDTQRANAHPFIIRQDSRFCWYWTDKWPNLDQFNLHWKLDMSTSLLYFRRVSSPISFNSDIKDSRIGGKIPEVVHWWG